MGSELVGGGELELVSEVDVGVIGWGVVELEDCVGEEGVEEEVDENDEGGELLEDEDCCELGSDDGGGEEGDNEVDVLCL